ncbi:hypothetical protein F5J12DRAFT_788081 [Pisolithus orientalis]|uniref:uncharacterized protein n=1 Tax=Pisolithus orientalis TaxID=936130 RepID=UPI0022252857|nr:uncharacterized protein F5J12DRAFT_788081 [Pisolithus orientalis]KAI5982791.1 hypothetical protein F5J12DRAFT_788081 [Pisolithus orientalis]
MPLTIHTDPAKLQSFEVIDSFIQMLWVPSISDEDIDIVMEDGETLPPGWNDPGPSIHMSTYSASRSTSGSPASCAGVGPSRPSSSAGRIGGDLKISISNGRHGEPCFELSISILGSTSKDTPLDILYIPDPSREVIKELGKFVYKLSESKEGMKVVVSEWLWLAMNMEEYNDGNAFELKYMKWADFKAIVLDPISQQSKWNELVRMDCIIGGIDYTIDFRRQVQFWPPPDQVRTAAVKWETLAHLQAISAIHRWVVPEMHIISDGDPIDDSYVLKRSHSDCGKHVILPTAPKSSRTWAHLKNNTNEDSDEVWIAQQYIPSLVFLGEWRVIIVGGQIMSVTHTHRLNNGGWSGIPVTSFLSLEEAGEIWYDALSSCLSYLELDLANRKDESLSIAERRKKIVNPQRGDIETRQRADGRVQQLRAKSLGRTSRTGNEDGMSPKLRLGYFVNEVERTPTTSFWLFWNINNTGGIMADTFAKLFEKWVRSITNVYCIA